MQFTGFRNLLIWNKIIEDLEHKPDLSILRDMTLRFKTVTHSPGMSTQQSQENSQIT